MKVEDLATWRELVLQHDNYTCRRCGGMDNIEAHHIKQRSLYPELALELSNGEALCSECHSKIPIYHEPSHVMPRESYLSKCNIPTVGVISVYRKDYKMRTLGQNGLNTVVSIPRVVIEREADKRGLSVEEFIEQFRAVAHYNNFDGVFYIFEEVNSESQKSS